MARTNDAAVKAVMAPGRDYDTARNPPLAQFIRVAERKIAQLIADCATYAIAVPDEDTLTDLETWVAAWAYKNSDQQQASGNAGRSSHSTKGQTGMGLESNHYGQTAIELDPTGLLQTKQKGAVVGGAWTGRPRSEQTPYEQRN